MSSRTILRPITSRQIANRPRSGSSPVDSRRTANSAAAELIGRSAGGHLGRPTQPSPADRKGPGTGPGSSSRGDNTWFKIVANDEPVRRRSSPVRPGARRLPRASWMIMHMTRERRAREAVLSPLKTELQTEMRFQGGRDEYSDPLLLTAGPAFAQVVVSDAIDFPNAGSAETTGVAPI